jgi:hypothetical protein
MDSELKLPPMAEEQLPCGHVVVVPMVFIELPGHQRGVVGVRLECPPWGFWQWHRWNADAAGA